MIVKRNRTYEHIVVISDADCGPFGDCFAVSMECENCDTHEERLVFTGQDKRELEAWRDAFVEKHKSCSTASRPAGG